MDTKDSYARLWSIGFSTIQELETERGILASGKEEIYGCIFGRDSLITSLKLLETYKNSHDEYLLLLVKKIILNLCELQGKNINVESGEEPGKCIHEYRPDNHKHLTNDLQNPWFIYPDNSMRNFDSVDSTPLFLLCIYEYYKLTKDERLVQQILPNINLSLDWILDYGDSNKDGFIDFYFKPERKFGGLQTQNWMDSTESLFHEDGTSVKFPVAPVEVQGYTFAALKSWSKYFQNIDAEKSIKLNERAERLKELFNERFVFPDENNFQIAFAIDGAGQPLLSDRSSIGHPLWSAIESEDGVMESILYRNHMGKLVEKLLSPDLFEPDAGIRTLSKGSINFSANSYHNGSIWPHDTSIIISGLEKFGFMKEAKIVKKALLKAYDFFQTPLELFVFENGKYEEYKSENGQTACRKQAWSAASLLRNLK